MQNIHLVNTQAVMPVVRFLQGINAPVYQLLEEANFPVEVLEGKHRIIATYSWWKLMQVAYDYSEDQALGFHISESSNLAGLSVFIDDVLPIAQSAHDGICLLLDYLATISSHAAFMLTHQWHGSWFIAQSQSHFIDGLVPMQQAVFADMLKFVQLFVGSNWQPELINVQHKDSHNVFNRYFPEASITDNSKNLGFFIPNEKLGRISDEVERYIDASKQQKIIPPTFKSNLRYALMPYGKEKLPQLVDVPTKVGLPVRTIQRYLANENTSFKEVIQQMRFDLAIDSLLNSDDKIIDIATMLGYKNPSNFARAFKEWTGLTPKQYRKHKAANLQS
ncbi:AraC family transcriptional regulator [Thalassotalea sp. HSM 43]|uniref:helix-turn-helix domain-containing protein n=1 Tax=Thalassotalea sp. HSM 43 TaxID=2552945 RepID=UPI001080D3EC|nr:helix-turn-helix domain-containing protein [Thalassotalea sp. HSM 43]QBY02989.1 AraC family transcriptional regulator [Thalassotalea sp. HSM 43]